MENTDKSITYCYSQIVPTRKNLRKIDLVVEGNIFHNGEMLYEIPPTEPLTFYISSFSTMSEDIIRYTTKVIERKALVNTSAEIEFRISSFIIDEKLGYNGIELGRIKENIKELIHNETFNIDSIIITATCSPDGSYKLNKNLAEKRGKELRKYIQNYITDYIDEIKNNEYLINIEDWDNPQEMKMANIHSISSQVNYQITSRHISEDWSHLFFLITNDNTLTNREKILNLWEISDFDARERALSLLKEYKYIKDSIYPQLRRVKFDFHLHRKGMIKDTIHTTTIDTIYNKGVEALKEKNFERAISLSGKYEDINSALAYISMDYNASALRILNKLPESGKRDYLLAIIHSRLGENGKAVELYLASVKKEPSLSFRGNLDPEISTLLEQYRVNSTIEDEI